MNPLSTVCSTAWDMHHFKKWAQSVHSSRSYSKNKVPYQLTPEERYPTFRAKIDLQNFIKWGVKYIWGDLPLQMEFNEPIRGVKVKNFNISHVETWNVPVTYWWNWPYVSWPISRKRLRETKRTLDTQGIRHTEFGSIRTTLWPNEKGLFLKIIQNYFFELIGN